MAQKVSSLFKNFIVVKFAGKINNNLISSLSALADAFLFALHIQTRETTITNYPLGYRRKIRKFLMK